MFVSDNVVYMDIYPQFSMPQFAYSYSSVPGQFGAGDVITGYVPDPTIALQLAPNIFLTQIEITTSTTGEFQNY